MKRITIPTLRKEIWRVLLHEVREIRITETPKDCDAHSEYTDTEIRIWIDRQKVRPDHAVIHEILHKVIDKYLENNFTYDVYEHFITSLERPIFRRLPPRELRRWKKRINQLIIVERKT